MTPRFGRETDDSGLGLIELIVAIVVSSIVLIAVGTVLINGWLTQNRVLSTSEATNRGQLVGSAIETAMRNALVAEVRSSGTELWIRTTWDDSGDARECQAFRLADGMAQLKTADSGLTAVAWGTWLAQDADRSWQTLVRKSGATPFFVLNEGTLTYTFDIETDSSPVRFIGEASMRSEGTWGSGPCW